MTFTLNCKTLMLKHAPAAVHVDKTARPQIISNIDNPRLYKILGEYKKINWSANFNKTQVLTCTKSQSFIHHVTL